MAELYRHTDEDGYRLELHSRPDGELLAIVVNTEHLDRGSVAADLAEVDGRRLLAELLRYYGSEEITKEEERRGR